MIAAELSSAFSSTAAVQNGSDTAQKRRFFYSCPASHCFTSYCIGADLSCRACKGNQEQVVVATSGYEDAWPDPIEIKERGPAKVAAMAAAGQR